MTWKNVSFVLLGVLLLLLIVIGILMAKIKKQSIPSPPVTVEEVIDYKNQEIDTTIQELTRSDSGFMKVVLEQRSQIKKADEEHKKNIGRINRLNDDSTLRQLAKNLSKSDDR